MKVKNIFLFFFLVLLASILTSCATIVGGSKYYAKVHVPNHPTAKIEYKNAYQGMGEVGTGEVVFKVDRKEAKNFSVTVKKDSCETQTQHFTQRKFRGWAFFLTIVGWTGIINGIPIPWGVAVDVATGALWKPDINEKGVSKQDYKHYIYRIDYTGCTSKEN